MSVYHVAAHEFGPGPVTTLAVVQANVGCWGSSGSRRRAADVTLVTPKGRFAMGNWCIAEGPIDYLVGGGDSREAE